MIEEDRRLTDICPMCRGIKNTLPLKAYYIKEYNCTVCEKCGKIEFNRIYKKEKEHYGRRYKKQ